MATPDGPKTTANPRRRIVLRGAAASGLALAGCDRLSESKGFVDGVLHRAERLSQAAHRLVGRDALAQEFTEADLSPEFRSNGTANPNNAAYQSHLRSGFTDWSLAFDGLVESPARFTLAELRALPARTQITRHDCVEGWSAIGKWTGVPLATLLDRVKPAAAARFVVFHCSDPMQEDGTQPYYESIDLIDARHPQTILAYDLNGQPLPVANGAPIRLRVERQLGYKHAKYVERIELVASYARIAGGRGGYWEDRGYQWYAGL